MVETDNNAQPVCYIDGNFRSCKGTCEHHCSPTCHPAQVGPEWKYGCTHMAWPSNRHGDFVPIVNCDGDPSKCDMRGAKFLGSYRRGLNTRLRNAQIKADELLQTLAKLDALTG